MPLIIEKPSIIPPAGNKPKKIREYFGRVNSKTSEISVAHMTSPAGWCEPGQQPEFDEYTIVLKGKLQVNSRSGKKTVKAGQAILAFAGEWVQYSSPFTGGAEYIAICLPAFSPAAVHRDHDASSPPEKRKRSPKRSR